MRALRRHGSPWNVLGFLDDQADGAGSFSDLPILGNLDWLEGRRAAVALAIGSPSARRRLHRAAKSRGAVFPTLVHPDAMVGDDVSLGEGSIVGAGAIVTANVRGGVSVIANIGATVSHDVTLGDFATIAPGAHIAGTVTVGEGADIGIGASVIQTLSIGEWSVVGAGAVVIRDVAPNSTVVGVPAHAVTARDAGWHRADDEPDNTAS